MKRGTKIGWLLIALAVVLSVWTIVSQSTDASTTSDGMVLSDDGTTLEGYTGAGGDVTIPSGVTTINAGVFDSKTITSVTMPDTVTTMGSGVFQGCTDLSSVTLSNNLTSIPADTFYECYSLGSLVIPSSVTSIGSDAFYGSSSLTTMTIPSSVSSISTDAFIGCSNLAEISVASGNSTYASSDGCLYNASRSRLLLVPEGKSSVAIAAGTTTIGAGAFSDCWGIDTLSLPSSVTTIEADAFSGSGIDTITIPSSVTSIASQSDWYPSTIYGASGSAAEQFAKDNGFVFVVIGNDDSDDGDDDNNNDDNNGNNDNNGNTNNNGGTDNGNNNGGTTDSGNTTDGSGDVVNPDGSITHADGSVTTADGRLIKAADASGDGTHTLDATPTTADGIDPRYFLSIAIFAGGIGVILYSRFNKMKYVSENRR